jgi:hypothetical protein
VLYFALRNSEEKFSAQIGRKLTYCKVVYYFACAGDRSSNSPDRILLAVNQELKQVSKKRDQRERQEIRNSLKEL